MAERNTEADFGTLDAGEQEIDEILHKVDDTPLSKDDWNMVVIETKSLSASWEQLVVYLGLPPDIINNTIRPSSAPWNEALNQWIKHNYNTKRYGLPSWRTLLKAVAQVDKCHFKKLADKYKGDVELASLADGGKPAGNSMFTDPALGKSTAAANGLTHLNQFQRGLMDLDMGMGHSGTGTMNELHQASRKGDLEEVKRLVEKQGFNPLQTDRKNGPNALHYAAWGGQLAVMKYFIEERGCKPTCQDVEGATPLHYASQRNHLELVRYLVDEENVDPTCIAINCSTPLHRACGGGNIDIVTFLVNAMTKYLPLKDVIELKDIHGACPIHHAAFYGHLEVIKFFATKPNFDPLITDNMGVTALHYAVWGGHLRIIEYFIEQLKCNPSVMDRDNHTPLHHAIAQGHLHVVKYFIEQLKCNPSPVDKNESTPLHTAAGSGHLEIVKYLTLEQHCDPLCVGKGNITPLHLAAMSGQLEVVKFYVETLHCPADVRADHYVTPIMFARAQGHYNVVLYLESITKLM